MKRDDMKGERAGKLGEGIQEAKFHEPTQLQGQLVKFGNAVKRDEQIKSKGLRSTIKKPKLGLDDGSDCSNSTDSMASDTSWESADLYDEE